jgi:hypothetical protein
MGEKKNAYIPSCPDEYYGGLGEWISWVRWWIGSKDINYSRSSLTNKILHGVFFTL